MVICEITDALLGQGCVWFVGFVFHLPWVCTLSAGRYFAVSGPRLSDRWCRSGAAFDGLWGGNYAGCFDDCYHATQPICDATRVHRASEEEAIHSDKLKSIVKNGHPSKLLYTFLEHFPFAGAFSQKTVKCFWAHMKDAYFFSLA